MNIAVVVLTHNESGNIARCLRSVYWATDILVVDSGSTDGTPSIAKGMGARVLTRPFDSFAVQRNFAMEAGDLRAEWTLHLDADEEVPVKLRSELEDLVVRGGDVGKEVYKVPSRLLLDGRWLKRSGMYPSYQVRFGRTESLRFIDHGHGQREVQSLDKVGTISTPLDHHNFSKGINDWFSRHLRYARLEAIENENASTGRWSLKGVLSFDKTVRRRSLKTLGSRMPFSPLIRFFYHYFIRGGLLDGRAGFQYSFMLAIYQYFIVLNRREIRQEQGASRG